MQAAAHCSLSGGSLTRLPLRQPCPAGYLGGGCLRPGVRLASRCRASGEASGEQSEEERRKLWMMAIKPPMYSVGFVPVLVGGAAVYATLGTAPWERVGGYVLASILIIAWLNLSNDAFDADTGVDKTKRESIVNLTGNKTGVLVLANILLLSGLALLYYLFTATGDARVLQMLAVAIVCGYVYQGPPFRFSYKGLGEPLCFLAFGLMATPAFFLALQPSSVAAVGIVSIPPLVWMCGVLVGMTTTIILFCSHFHQIEGDIAAGKRSPLVKLGVEKGFTVLNIAVALVYLLAAAGALQGALSVHAVAATLLSVPSSLTLLKFARNNRSVPALIAPLKKYAVIWHIFFGVSLCAGLMLGR